MRRVAVGDWADSAMKYIKINYIKVLIKVQHIFTSNYTHYFTYQLKDYSKDIDFLIDFKFPTQYIFKK